MADNRLSHQPIAYEQEDLFPESATLLSGRKIYVRVNWRPDLATGTKALCSAKLVSKKITGEFNGFASGVSAFPCGSNNSQVPVAQRQLTCIQSLEGVLQRT